MTRSTILTAAALVATNLWGCPASQTEPRNVQYGNSSPVGQWQTGAGTTSALGGGVAGTTPFVSGTAGTTTGGTAGVGATTAGTGIVETAGVGDTGGVAGDGTIAGTIATAGVGATAGTGPAAGTGAPSLTMSFDVTTLSQGGNYAPRNVGAIWVATAAGQFVKTLEVWAFIRASHLNKWNAETAGNRVDAVSSATLSNHRAHHVTWNMLDANGSPVPDGAYKVIIELTDHNSAGQWASVDFTKGPTPMTMTAPDQQYFTGMQVVIQ